MIAICLAAIRLVRCSHMSELVHRTDARFLASFVFVHCLRVAIEPQFSSVSPFSEGLARVRIFDHPGNAPRHTEDAHRND